VLLGFVGVCDFFPFTREKREIFDFMWTLVIFNNFHQHLSSVTFRVFMMMMMSVMITMMFVLG
jgi:hypothetical protein